MSNEVNINKMYQFIASFQKDGGSWSDVADSDYGNDDGTVIKAEFRAFVNGEFANWNGNEGGTVSNDLINQFWKKIDTNTSASKISGTKLKNLNALDKKELATLEKKLEAYVALDEFVASNVIVPAVLTTTGSQWKNAVVSELSALVEKYIQGGCKDDLNAILTEALPAIANKNTAEFCALEYQETLKKGVLAGYPEYDVTTDETLTALLTKFLESVSADTTPEEIKSEIRSIMDAYLGTAGIGDTESPYDLTELGFDYGKINGIQTAVITQTIKNALANEAKNYEGYEKEFDAAVQEFINAKLGEGLSFEELKGCAGQFTSSTAKKKLDQFVEVNNLFQNIDLNKLNTSLLFLKLQEVFGKESAKVFLEEIKYGFHDDLIKEVMDRFNAGEFRKADGSIDFDSLFKVITDKLADVSVDTSNFDIAALNSMYKNKLDLADKNEDGQAYIDYAKEYCKSLAAKGDDYKAVIKEVFGTDDYTTKIDSLKIVSKIKPLITQLMDKAEEVEKLIEQKATQAEVNKTLASAAKTVVEMIPDFENKELSNIINGKASFHTEFGIDRSGNIVFQETDTKTVYNLLVTKLKNSLDNSVIKDIGGESVLKKLVQAAWIMTYNDFNSSQSNSTAAFISKVLDNLTSIMNKLQTNPEYLSIFTQRTSYTDSTLTSGLIHYNTNTTYGNDELISYKGTTSVDSNGAVHIANTNDDPDYQLTMNALLDRLVKKYPSIDSKIITSVFRDAQLKAITTAQSNTADCPYGTGNNDSRVEDTIRNWGGEDSRHNDEYGIHMDELVQLTLYYFDKLLYAELIK